MDPRNFVQTDFSWDGGTVTFIMHVNCEVFEKFLQLQSFKPVRKTLRKFYLLNSPTLIVCTETLLLLETESKFTSKDSGRNRKAFDEEREL